MRGCERSNNSTNRKESRRMYVKVLHFAVDVSQKALSPLSLDERNAALLQEHSDYTCKFQKSALNVALEKTSVMLRLSMAPLFWDLYFGIIGDKLNRDDDGRVFEAANQHWTSYIEPIIPWEPPLFLHSARRMNCNTSPCVLLEHQSQLHAQPHEGHEWWCVCEYSCVCVWDTSPVFPLLPTNTINKGHCGWMTVWSPYPSYGQPLITSGVIKNQAAVATIKCLWETIEKCCCWRWNS